MHDVVLDLVCTILKKGFLFWQFLKQDTEVLYHWWLTPSCLHPASLNLSSFQLFLNWIGKCSTIQLVTQLLDVPGFGGLDSHAPGFSYKSQRRYLEEWLQVVCLVERGLMALSWYCQLCFQRISNRHSIRAGHLLLFDRFPL